MTFSRIEHPRDNAPRERATLLGFAAVMLLSGVGLAVFGGAPRLPENAPRLEQVAAVLSGSTLPVQAIVLVLVDLAWLVWLWIVGSLAVEALVAAVEVAAHGAAWARSLRRMADRVTFPLARRAVAAAFAVQILSRGVPLAAAQPLTPADVAIVAEASRPTVTEGLAAARETAAEPTQATYIVRPGDTLWSIADRAYGSGLTYRRLVEANVGRRMADGNVFAVQGVIQPGWELVVPEMSVFVDDVDGQRWYTVQAGDTLSSVAAALLGDDSRWTELFDLNRGAPSADGTHTLNNPNVIWPGLRLVLPPAPPPAVEAAEPATADLVAASTTSTVASSPPPPSDVLPPPTEQSSVQPREEIAPPPLVRTLHVVDPIALEPSVDAQPAEESTPPEELVQEVAPPASADARPNDFGTTPIALGGLGLVALAGVAFGARRMRRLRPLPHEAENEVVVEGGFAEAQLSPDFTRGMHGRGFDPVAAIVDQLRRFLDEYELGHVGIVAVRHGRSATTVTLAAGLAEQPILVDLAPVFASRLEADAEAWISPDQDVVVRLVRVRKTRLLPAADTHSAPVCLVPLGVLYDRQMLLASCHSLGHVLIASLPGHGADTILGSLVATLTARRSPEELRMWMIAHSRALAAPLFELPHLTRTIDPADQPALALAVEDLRAELDRRTAHQPGADLVVVIPELTSLGDLAGSFELLASRAAALGVRFIAATSSPEEAVLSPLLGHLGTRMVLRMQHEEASVALLGVADAAFLGGGGRLLLRLDGREPVELYGYHVAPEHLERLVRLMHTAYPAGASAPPSPTNRVYDESNAASTLELEYSAHRADPYSQPELTAELQPEPTPNPESDLNKHPEPELNAEPEAELKTEPEPEQSLEPRLEPEPELEPELKLEAAAALSGEPLVAEAASEPADAAAPAVADLPPIQVTCFGSPRVVCAGQQVWPRRPSGEAKPWEFLLYLACQPSEGVASEDALEALWPDDDDAPNPGHRFRQLRYRLRHMLATVDGAPETDGVCLERGTLRLDPGIVYSDAREFLGLVRSARLDPGPGAIAYLERARNLYVGDLLEGPDARRYPWVDERDDSGVTLREHFRRLFQHASSRLAELYAASGQVQAAMRLYRELTDIDPADEQLWRALFRLHAGRGDRPALVREEHRMRAALRNVAADLEDADNPQAEVAEPGLETVQEYQRLLTGLRERTREAAAV